jgi:hypothetical protein
MYISIIKNEIFRLKHLKYNFNFLGRIMRDIISFEPRGEYIGITHQSYDVHENNTGKRFIYKYGVSLDSTFVHNAGTQATNTLRAIVSRDIGGIIGYRNIPHVSIVINDNILSEKQEYLLDENLNLRCELEPVFQSEMMARDPLEFPSIGYQFLIQKFGISFERFDVFRLFSLYGDADSLDQHVISNNEIYVVDLNKAFDEVYKYNLMTYLNNRSSEFTMYQLDLIRLLASLEQEELHQVVDSVWSKEVEQTLNAHITIEPGLFLKQKRKMENEIIARQKVFQKFLDTKHSP